MGSHLQLYASKNVSLEDARTWCRCKVKDILEPASAADAPAVSRVDTEMSKLDRTSDHLEHWSAGGALAAFPFLNCAAHLCNLPLVERATMAGFQYRKWQMAFNPTSDYAAHDWENDAAVKFLRSHIGFVVWGYNDGI